MQNKKILSLFLFYKLKKKKKITHASSISISIIVQRQFKLDRSSFFFYLSRDKKNSIEIYRVTKNSSKFPLPKISKTRLLLTWDYTLVRSNRTGPVKSNETDSIIIVIPRPDYTRRVRMHRMG